MLPNYFLEQGLIIALLKTWPTVTYLTGLPKQPPAGKGHGSLEKGACHELELLTGKPESIAEPQTGF